MGREGPVGTFIVVNTLGRSASVTLPNHLLRVGGPGGTTGGRDGGGRVREDSARLERLPTRILLC